jgi:23S rRNA A2030 N6-methylase RlmJ
MKKAKFVHSSQRGTVVVAPTLEQKHYTYQKVHQGIHQQGKEVAHNGNSRRSILLLDPISQLHHYHQYKKYIADKSQP